ncbi:hypothetical protein BC940DRAFT_330632 [Gongronella butleri]|nr:hypothetical protein BC940DRAFT_330632 [Gongronella butleri]
MTSLQQLLEGVSPELHSHKVLEVLKSPSIKDNPNLFNNGVQFLRIKAIKGDVDAKLKLSTMLDGHAVGADDALWQPIVDQREADLWSKTVFDRRLSAAIAPSLALVEADLLHVSNTTFRLMDRILEEADKLEDDNDDDTGSDEATTAAGSATGPATGNGGNGKSAATTLVADMAFLVGLLHLKGVALAKSLDDAMHYLGKASRLDHDEATFQVAVLMDDFYAHADLYDHQRSIALFEQLVTRRKRRSNMSTASTGSNSNGTTTTNHNSSSNNSHGGGGGSLEVRAAIKLARAYFEGDHQGEHRDMDKAYRYARKVAEHSGEKYCQYIVGDTLLQKGDVQQAVFWLTQAGQQGFPLAIEALARVYFQGVPPTFKKDYDAAYEWCLKGDDIWPSGLGYCQCCLGDMHREGLGVQKDQLKSFEYYQKAASQQDAPQNYARYRLGEMFYHGEDNWIQNIPVAKDYYRAAAKDQYEPARQRLEQIEQDERQEQQQLDAQPKKEAKPWSLMALFSGRRRVHA